MAWEQTDFSMAARAGRIDELRAEGDRARQTGDLVRRRRSRRLASVGGLTSVPLASLRRGLARPLSALARGLGRLAISDVSRVQK